MAVDTQRRAPGIRFEVTPPPAAEALPRMDIAAFAGFASSGPLDVPVPIEDAAEYRAIFGGRVRLAWDPQRSAWQYGMMDSAVEQFFANGGRRCWTVRVAGPAAVNRFAIPGLAAFGDDGELRPAIVQARSEGSWSDGVLAGSALLSDALEAGPLRTGSASKWELPLNQQLRKRVQPGDLIRLSWDGTGLLAFVDHADGPADAPLLRFGSRAYAFRIPGDGVVDDVGSAVLFDGGAIMAGVGEVSIADSVYEVFLPGFAAAPREGSALRLSVGDSRIWITIEGARETTEGVVVTGEGLWLLRSVPSELPTGKPYAERLLWEFSGQIDAATRVVRSDSGFVLTKEDLPSDATRFRGGALPPTSPLFPFALPDTSEPVLCLPAGAGARRRFLGCAPSNVPALARDGLSAFSSSMFLDAKLSDVSAASLLAVADFERYTGPTPRPLRGLHSLLGIEEVSMIAAPDAALRAWENSAQAQMRPPRQAEPAPVIRGDRFTQCGLRALPTPEIVAAPPDRNGATVLSWTPVEGARYTVTESGDPEFGGETVIYEGTQPSLRVAPRLPGDVYYRVRAAVGSSGSGWSAGVGVRTLGGASYRVAPEYSNTELLNVHRAMLRMCGARGDAMALLSFPSHFEERACVSHARQLRQTRPDEARTLSFGSFYHPWLLQRSADGEFALTPPDGAVAGLWARRAIARGAWIAPANETLRGPAGLSPALARANRLDLLTAQLNEIIRDSRGFLVLSEDTLSGDEDLRPIHVRRLLILLRRVVLREGNRYAFEPHSLQFRRLVRRTIESVLDGLHERGAFSGKTRAASFQVVIDDGPNALTSIDAGRLVCEVRVAPARALAFLTVRLMQTGGALAVEEA